MMSAGVWVALVVGLAGLLWWWNEYWYALPFYLRRRGGGATPKLPPGHMGLPFVGEMPLLFWYFLVRRPDDFINAKHSKYGDGIGVYRTHLLGSPGVVVCTPSAIKFVLQSESRFGLGKWIAKELVGQTSLVAVEGAAHSRVRGLLIRAINRPDALRKITVMVQPRVMASLKSWANTGRITGFKQAKKLIFANTGKFFASFEADHVLDTLDHLVEGVINGFGAYPLNFRGTAHHYAIQCRRKAVAIFREELEKRKQSEAGEPKNDLMESLMQMKDEEGNTLSDSEVIDNIVSLVIAGYSSTSLVITWALYYLAKYPDVLQKLREEHMLVSDKLKGDLVTYEEIASCKYTSKVVEELIRMANVSLFTIRTAREDVEYRGYVIPKGWRVVCWLRSVHTSPEYYEDPMRFNPDRWNEAPKPGSYLVFGGGRRVCPGNMYARLQVSIVLHYLVVGYRWKLVNPDAGIRYLPHPTPADEVEIDITQI